ncbi:MAG: EVE domain-containing protein [Williamsia sp.]|nr:EVE domain-containing protein [Williamsia sp.]
MAYWLLKSEPASYSWEQLEKDGFTAWTGVRNYAARNFLRQMQPGDQAFYYHSGEGTEIVGIARITKAFYQDPTSEDSNWVAVDIEPVKKLDKAVTLRQIKGEKRLAEMALVKLSRLSVQPVTEAEWNTVLELAGEKAWL